MSTDKYRPIPQNIIILGGTGIHFMSFIHILLQAIQYKNITWYGDLWVAQGYRYTPQNIYYSRNVFLKETVTILDLQQQFLLKTV